MDRLKQAAELGNINDMYNCLREDRDAFRWVDEAELVDTPLHIAAKKGHVDFAMAMMYLKPCYGSKLNPELYSPMHLAVRNGYTKVVLGLLAIDKDLIRVKGKEGYTALHYAAENGDSDVLAKFLKDCPTCIEDVTIRNETALHVAASNGRLEALEILARFLQRTHLYCNVSTHHLLDYKDINGNTVFHSAASNTDPQMIKLLLECGVDTNEKNDQGLTALKLLEQSPRPETRKRQDCLTMIRKGKAIRLAMDPTHAAGFWTRYNFFSSSNVDTSLHEKLRYKVTQVEKIFAGFTRKLHNISADKVNALLVVLALMLTATYQALINPAGGVWQAEYSANRSTSGEAHVGQSVMDIYTYGNFFWLNFYAFYLASILTVTFLQVATGSHLIAMIFELQLSLLIACLFTTLKVTVPTTTTEANNVPIGIQNYFAFIIVTSLIMEATRWLIIGIYNPPALRFYRDFFRQM